MRQKQTAEKSVNMEDVGALSVINMTEDRDIVLLSIKEKKFLNKYDIGDDVYCEARRALFYGEKEFNDMLKSSYLNSRQRKLLSEFMLGDPQ